MEDWNGNEILRVAILHKNDRGEVIETFIEGKLAEYLAERLSYMEGARIDVRGAGYGWREQKVG